MIIDEEVRAALETLRRHAAGNDFELHRIDVLERDLTAPPAAEQIDETHQRFDGLNYTRDKYGHYYRNVAIHQDIWRYYHGDIPNDGARYEVHHDDWNPENNTPSNLVLLTSSEHRKIHNPKSETIAPQAEFICEICGKKYVAPNTGTNRFCSRECLRKWHSVNGCHHQKTCPVCGKQFQAKKAQRIYCSLACLGVANRHRESRVCPTCGKTFVKRLSDPRKYCSRECYNKSRRSEFGQSGQA